MLLTQDLKVLAKQVNSNLLKMRYHYMSNSRAIKALENIEKQKGKLNTKSRKKSLEYATEILGWRGYAPWLNVYTAISGSFKEGWIPDNYYGKVVIPKIQGEYGKISFLKPLTNKLLNNSVCPDLAYFINGQWFSTDFKRLQPKQVINKIFSQAEKFCYKVDDTYQGRGVFIYDKKSLDIDLLQNKGNGVLQSYIMQHAFFTEFHLTSTATIRMTTVIDSNGNPSLRASYLRLGRNNDTHIISDSHIRIPINNSSGKLHEVGYLANWQSIDHHPDSKIFFLNKIIPNFDDCIRLVLHLHEQLVMVRAIGWDLTVNQQGDPVLMEWNGYSNDIKFSEATLGPCFKDLGWI